MKISEIITEAQIAEEWSKKYKDSINCKNPKGFSQKAHCAGRNKNESAQVPSQSELDKDENIDEARKRKKSKRKSSSANRSPVPRFYGAWGFGDSEGGDGGGE